MQSENFSPKDSLLLIDSMINQAKNRFTENGFLYLLWGWLILISAVGHFVLLKLQLFKHPEIIWMSCWVAIIFQIIFLVRKKKKEKVKTYSDGIVDNIWMCFGICMMVLSIIVSKNNLWMYMYPIILMLYGIPTFLSGVVMQFTPLKIGGISCWVLAVVATFFLPIYYLLLLAVAVLIAWIIPGYLLRKKFKNQN
jgi:hypothetical protein